MFGIAFVLTMNHSSVSDAGAAAVTALEAAWALTNLAAADHEVACAVLPAAPALILHLAGGSGIAVAQQAAWTLGEQSMAPLVEGHTGPSGSYRQSVAMFGVGAFRILLTFRSNIWRLEYLYRIRR